VILVVVTNVFAREQLAAKKAAAVAKRSGARVVLFNTFMVPQPASDAVWVDGQWAWRDRYFAWQRGGWVRPPKDAYYAPWARYYTMDGTLYFADGTWRSSRDGQRLPEPQVLLPAVSPANDETPEGVISP